MRILSCLFGYFLIYNFLIYIYIPWYRPWHLKIVHREGKRVIKKKYFICQLVQKKILFLKVFVRINVKLLICKFIKFYLLTFSQFSKQFYAVLKLIIPIKTLQIKCSDSYYWDSWFTFCHQTHIRYFRLSNKKCTKNWNIWTKSTFKKSLWGLNNDKSSIT